MNLFISMEKDSRLMNISLETNEKETKNRINHGSIKSSRKLA